MWRWVPLLGLLLALPAGAANNDWVTTFASDACGATSSNTVARKDQRIFYCPTITGNSETFRVTASEAKICLECGSGATAGACTMELHIADTPQPLTPDTNEFERFEDGLVTSLNGDYQDANGDQRRCFYGLDPAWYYINMVTVGSGTEVITVTGTRD